MTDTDETSKTLGQLLAAWMAQHLHRPNWPRGLFSSALSVLPNTEGRMVHSGSTQCMLCGEVYEHPTEIRSKTEPPP